MTGISLTGILTRFILGGGAVAIAYVLARKIGGRWGGIFAAFPAVFIAAIVTIATGATAVAGLALTVQVSKGALVGMVANIICAAAAARLVPRLGWSRGVPAALGVWLVTVVMIYSLALKTGLVR